MFKRVGLGLVAVILFLGSAQAKNFWESKPYTQWKAKDAKRLLEKSPWTYEFSYGQTGNIGGNVAGMGGTPDVFGQTPEDATSGADSVSSEREIVTYIRIHLFSARPVRQAFVASFADGDPAKLEKMKDFANRDFGDEIVLSWTLDSKPKGATTVMDIERALHAQALAELQNNTFLATDDGRKVYIKDYLPPTRDGTGAKFVFPRNLPDGTPLVGPETKSIKFQTKRFKMKDQEVAVDATFQIKDMNLDGRLEY